MSFFFDTNVVLGYCFRCDPFHNDSINAFLLGGDFYWSNKVKNEFKKVHHEIKHLLSTFLTDLYDFVLLNNNIIKKNAVIKYIKDRYGNIDHFEKFINTANIFWNKNNFKNKMNKRVVLDALQSLIFQFEYISDSYKNNIEDKLILSSLNIFDFPDYEELFSLLKDIRSHYEDINIILDAHYLSKNIKDKLYFITFDNGIHSYAHGKTNIHKFCHPNEL